MILAGHRNLTTVECHVGGRGCEEGGCMRLRRANTPPLNKHSQKQVKKGKIATRIRNENWVNLAEQPA